ncbi:NnrS family protein [Bradyrhizobium sp. CB3481]|uniref:NnrS family protein n=1 Tax=Bradyrhizobium sp. CB3481 TaxID=3039158 RepID=UPI0024B25189|nr:NnrS family protein [Bradyrhizobium sp. CB3481]WFU18598.1 NnrS family protein [Bradyrhizobium sp. CB3481]
MATMQKLRTYQGPALFSYGFRPFFLFGAIYAGAMVPLWLVVFAGNISLPSALAPRDWHLHEMLFGYVGAVIAGFLLTAVPNWTGRLPIQGMPLAILFAAWLAGRLAVTFSALIGWEIALAIDAAFLLLLAAAAAREIVAGRKWNNLKVVGIISLLAAANIAFHVEAHLGGVAEYSTRIGVGLVVTLVCLIGGRIVPSFTRNWLARREPGRLPVPFNRFDAITMAAGVGAIVAWVVAPSGRLTAAALCIAGVLHVVRLARWAGDRTISDRLVLILHIAYAFVPAGFLLAALAALDLVAPSAGIHAWTGGAIGSMTIAVMTRASLGHTGQTLSASIATQLVYASIVIAALARVCAALEPAHSVPLLTIAGAAWAAAFLGFALVYAPLLCRVRKP